MTLVLIQMTIGAKNSEKDVSRVILKTACKKRRGPNEIINELLRKNLAVVRAM